MAALGAEVVLVDQAPGGLPGQVSGEDLNLVDAEAARIEAGRGAFRANQFDAEDNALAHERHTGPELWEQSGGRLDAFATIAGTCGTYTGVMRYLRRVSPGVRGYLIEPACAAVLAGDCVGDARHKIQGSGYARPDLPLFDRTLVTEYTQVTDVEAIEATRALASEEGVFAGDLIGSQPRRCAAAAGRSRARSDGRHDRLRQWVEVLEHGRVRVKGQ